MSNQNQHKPGYKHTPLGWIPEEWDVKSLQDVVEKIVGGGTPSRNNPAYWNGSCYWATVKDLSNFNPLATQETITEEGVKNSSTNIVPAGTIVTATRMALGKAVVFETDVAINQDLKAVFPSQDVDNSFLYYWFINNASKIEQKGNGSTVKWIVLEDLKSLPFFKPLKCQQRKIAAILSTWDEAITKTQQLIAQLQQRNKGLMQQLLTGKKRLKEFKKQWKEIHLADAFNERSETGFVNLDLLSVGSLGVYPQSQSEKRDTSNSDKAKYKRICPGDIGYNTMRMWQGRSALSSIEGIVSPAYTIVTPKERQHSEFYAYLFKLPAVVNKFYRNSQGLVEDTLNCKFKDFSIVKVEVPEYEEQVAIANVLTTARAEIKSYEQKLVALQQQKKGLMQKLLTGEVRVKV